MRFWIGVFSLMVFVTWHLGEDDYVSPAYANQHLRDNMLVLEDLIFARSGTVNVHARRYHAGRRQFQDWQVIGTIAAGELSTDLFFEFACRFEKASADPIQGEFGWRLLGSDTVVTLRDNITDETDLAFLRLLHSSQANQGIIEIVGRNLATEARQQTAQWSTAHGMCAIAGHGLKPIRKDIP